MIQAPRTAQFTAEDRHAFPSDGRRWEVLEGALVVSPAPSVRHQRISSELVTRLLTHLRHEGLVLHAPVDVVLGAGTVCQPDVVFVSAGRRSIVEEDAIVGAPDLVIEILSPSTRRTDLVLKAKLYLQAGVAAYWVVDPDLDRLEAFARVGDVWSSPVVATSPEVFEPAAFPGLALPLREVFGR